jgi:hypothetical protein
MSLIRGARQSGILAKKNGIHGKFGENLGKIGILGKNWNTWEKFGKKWNTCVKIGKNWITWENLGKMWFLEYILIFFSIVLPLGLIINALWVFKTN